MKLKIHISQALLTVKLCDKEYKRNFYFF